MSRAARCSCSASLTELCLSPKCSTLLSEDTPRRWHPTPWRAPEPATACQGLGELLQPVSWQSQLTWAVPAAAAHWGLATTSPWQGVPCRESCAEQHVPHCPGAGEGQSPCTTSHLHGHKLTTTCPQLPGPASSKGQLRTRLALPSAPRQRSPAGTGAHHVSVLVTP